MTNQPEGQAPKPGRGLDLFFGDEPEEAIPEAAPPEAAAPEITEDSLNTNGGPRPVEAAVEDLAEALPAEEVDQLVETSADKVDDLADDLAEGAALAASAGDDVAGAVEEKMAGAVEGIQEESEAPVTAVAATAAVASVDDLPVVGVDHGSAPPAEPVRPQAASGGQPPLVVATTSDDSGSSFMRSAALVLLGALLGTALVLAILFAVNGDLTWSPRNEVANLQGNVTTLQETQGALTGRMDANEASLIAVGSDVDTLKDDTAALSSQQGQFAEEVAALTTNAEAMQAELDAVGEDLAVVSENVDLLNSEVEQLAISAARSDTFLEGMRDLMTDIYPPEEPVEAVAPLTTTEGLTETEVIEPAEEITTTEGLTETEVIAPAEEITTTEDVTGTEALEPGEAITVTEGLTETEEMEPAEAVTATGESGVVAPAGETEEEAPIETPIIRENNGEEPPAVETPISQSGIRGMVFKDTNSNGERDLGELGIGNVKVTLYSQDRVELDSIITDSSGSFLFAGLPPGRYVLTETDASGYASSTLNSITVILRSGGLATVNFGDYPLK